MSNTPFDNDVVRRLIEMPESPEVRLTKEIRATTPDYRSAMKQTLEAAKSLQLQVSPALELLRQEMNLAQYGTRLLQQTDIHPIQQMLKETKNAFDLIAGTKQWAELSNTLSQIHSLKFEDFSVFQQIEKDLKKCALEVNASILPLAEITKSFTEAAAISIKPLTEEFAKDSWKISLSDRMDSLKTPWAIENHLGVSIVGFTRLARLHDLSTSSSPFNRVTSDTFDEELGQPVPFDLIAHPNQREEASIDAGLNPEIISFPIDAYPQVLFSAGFKFSFESVPPIGSDGGDDSGVIDPQHNNLLYHVENRLRRLIETELKKLNGDHWLRRIHGEVRKKWNDRKIKDQDQRGDSYSVIYYADFMDLSDIICQSDNWNAVFHGYFFSKQDFQISMQRLFPVRNAIGHNRPLVRADQITLYSEASRILKALGVQL